MLGSLRGGRALRTVFGLAAVVIVTVAVCIAVLSLADAPLAVARTVVVLGGAAVLLGFLIGPILTRSEEHTSELQSLMRISYAVFCLKKKKKQNENRNTIT